MSAPVDVSALWTCGCFLHGDWTTGEPPVCPAEFETTEDRDDWESGVCTAQCPDCGMRLAQQDGHAVIQL